MENQNIYLIGFMGSGKSYLGKQLAQTLRREFLDLDAFIEANEGMSISQIFAKGGEFLFRTLEKDYLHATNDFQNMIIATGGGAPCFFNNMEWMNQHGQTVYLKTPVSILEKRLREETAHRPLLAGKTVEELKQFIDNKLSDRTTFYEQSSLVFEYQTGTENINDFLEKLEKK